MSPKKKATLTRKAVESLLRGVSLSPALPWAVFDISGDLCQSSDRMKKLLGHKGKIPLEGDRAEAIWPFHNEEDSEIALFRKIVRTKTTKSLDVVYANALLKNFQLCILEVPRMSHLKVVVAKMLRSGDVMKDRAARQELFRSISHEVRTSVHALRGYIDILEKDPALASTVHKRINVVLGRLNKVVERLDEFKSVLELTS